MYKNRNKEYLFIGVFDIILYIMLTIIYPVITYFLQIPKTNSNSLYELLVTGLFFTGAFFYDFYSKYESSENKYRWVLNVLLAGNIMFGLCSLAIIILIILVSFEMKYVDQIFVVFHFIPLLAVYPFTVSIIEMIKRIVRKHKGKLSHVSM